MKRGYIILTYFLPLTNAIFAQSRIAAQVDIGGTSPLVSKTVTTIHKPEILNIYPNRARSRLYVQIAETATLTLINENGKPLSSKSFRIADSLMCNKYRRFVLFKE